MSITNITLVTPSKGMQVVQINLAQCKMNNLQILWGRPWTWPNNKTTSISASFKYQFGSCWRSLCLICFKDFFATEKVTSLKNEAQSIEPSAFLPQKNACLVKHERSTEMNATLENVMDFTNSHKTKGKATISCIGRITSMIDFSSLCINMNTIITAICSRDMPQPILCQILLNFVAIVNNPDWVHWYESVGGMPLLHWYSYSYLERNFNCFANFATVLGNGKVMSKSFWIPELNTKALVHAVIVMKTFCDQINLHQAMMTPIMVIPGVIAAYTISLWNNTQACGPPKNNNNSSLIDGASHSNSNHKPNIK